MKFNRIVFLSFILAISLIAIAFADTTPGILTFNKKSFEGGQMLPVYSGPGYEYIRANDTAEMSTDDTVWMAGRVGDWALVMYQKTKGFRTGWIDASKLQYRLGGEELTLEHTPATLASDCILTDDPKNRTSSLAELKAGESVTYLASYTDHIEWAYIEVWTDQPVCGFVPMTAVEIAGQRLAAEETNAANTYTGTAEGFGGPVSVTLTISNDRITDCVIVGEKETPGIGAEAVKAMPARIIAANSYEVDGITGATYTSDAIREAAKAALEAAGGASATEEVAAARPVDPDLMYTDCVWGMTPDEVIQVMGEPDPEVSRVDENGDGQLAMTLRLSRGGSEEDDIDVIFYFTFEKNSLWSVRSTWIGYPAAMEETYVSLNSYLTDRFGEGVTSKTAIEGSIEKALLTLNMETQQSIFKDFTAWQLSGKTYLVQSYAQTENYNMINRNYIDDAQIGVRFEARSKNVPEPASSAVPATVTIRRGGDVNVRQKPDQNSTRVGRAKAGKVYMRLSTAENGWYEIELENGVTGFISPNMVQ